MQKWLTRLGRARLYLVLLVLAAVLPPAIGGYVPQQAASYLIFGLFALSVGLVTGYVRLFNIGLGATFGVGSYTVAILSQHGLTQPVLLLLASLAAGVVISLLFSIYAIVADGIEYLMLTFLTTLAFFNIPSLSTEWMGGDNGLTVKGGLDISFGIDPLEGNGFYYFVLAVVAICVALSVYVMASQAGKAMQAVGRNPVRAAAMGYNVNWYRTVFTVFTGLLATVAGWLYALQTAFVFENLLGLNNSLYGLVYAMVGGIDTILGPVLGAAGLRFISELFSSRSTQSSLYVGLVLVIVVYFLPDGVVGLWQRISRRVRSLSAVKMRKAATAESDSSVAALSGD